MCKKIMVAIVCFILQLQLDALEVPEPFGKLAGQVAGPVGDSAEALVATLKFPDAQTADCVLKMVTTVAPDTSQSAQPQSLLFPFMQLQTPAATLSHPENAEAPPAEKRPKTTQEEAAINPEIEKTTRAWLNLSVDQLMNAVALVAAWRAEIRKVLIKNPGLATEAEVASRIRIMEQTAERTANMMSVDDFSRIALERALLAVLDSERTKKGNE